MLEQPEKKKISLKRSEPPVPSAPTTPPATEASKENTSPESQNESQEDGSPSKKLIRLSSTENKTVSVALHWCSFVHCSFVHLGSPALLPHIYRLACLDIFNYRVWNSSSLFCSTLKQELRDLVFPWMKRPENRLGQNAFPLRVPKQLPPRNLPSCQWKQG